MSEDDKVVEQTTEKDETLDLDQSTGENQEDAQEGGAEGETPDEKISRLERTNKQLHARINKPEKKKPAPQVDNSNLTREEGILIARGHTTEELDLANKLASVNNISVLEAAEDVYFQSTVTARRKKEKASKAALGASSGSGSQNQKSPTEMTEQEAAADWNAAFDG